MDPETSFIFSKFIVSGQQIRVNIIQLTKNSFIFISHICLLDHLFLLIFFFAVDITLRMIFDILTSLKDVIAFRPHEIHSFSQAVFYEITSIRCLALRKATKVSLWKAMVDDMPGK